MRVNRPAGARAAFILFAAAALAARAAEARAELVLSELIVELKPGQNAVADVDVWNNSPDRAYVAAEPREILNPGTPEQRARTDPDPEKLGLLVAPARMILEPGQHKLLRIAALATAAGQEHVYRVAVKPEVGHLESDRSGLKILVGYDVLVLVRPIRSHVHIVATRSGNTLTFTNDGNISVELADGRQCQSLGKGCLPLPGKRLYAGAQWSEPLKSGGPVEYDVISPTGIDHQVY
jgi:P pilus assembly chaperone PapD